jgi:hypothetical protein
MERPRKDVIPRQLHVVADGHRMDVDRSEVARDKEAGIEPRRWLRVRTAFAVSTITPSWRSTLSPVMPQINSWIARFMELII